MTDSPIPNSRLTQLLYRIVDPRRLGPLTEEGVAARVLCPVVIGVVASVIFFYQLGTRGLWIDEVFSLELVKMPWGKMCEVFTHDEGNQILYHLLLRQWLVFAESPLALRSLSLIFSVGAVVFTYEIGRKLLSPFVGILSALLLMTNQIVISQAQEARGYAMVLFLVCAASLVWIYCLDQPASPWLWCLYASLGTAAIYTHFFGALVLWSHLVALIALRRKQIPIRPVLVTFSSIFLLCLPLAFFVLFRGSSQTDWVRPLSKLCILEFLFQSGGSSFRSMYLRWALIVIGLITMIALMIRKRGEPASRNWAAIAAWLFVPVLLVSAVSFVKPMFVAKYMIVVLPAVALLIAACAGCLRPKWLRYLSLLLLVRIGFHGMYWAYLVPPLEDWQPAARQVVTASCPDDVVIVYCPFTKLGFDHYATQVKSAGRPQYVPYFVPTDNIHPLYCVPEGYTMGGAQPPVDPDLLKRIEEHHPNQVWLVISHAHFERLGRAKILAELQKTIQERYRTRKEYHYRGVTVLRFSPSPSLSPGRVSHP